MESANKMNVPMQAYGRATHSRCRARAIRTSFGRSSLPSYICTRIRGLRRMTLRQFSVQDIETLQHVQNVQNVQNVSYIRSASRRNDKNKLWLGNAKKSRNKSLGTEKWDCRETRSGIALKRISTPKIQGAWLHVITVLVMAAPIREYFWFAIGAWIAHPETI